MCSDTLERESLLCERCEKESESDLTRKEYGTIIFSLEEYQAILEKEGDISMRNKVIDLIHKVCTIQDKTSE